MRDAAAALIVRSANDVATAVAEALAGNERRFALRMTQKARQIGMNRTTFRNASWSSSPWTNVDGPGHGCSNPKNDQPVSPNIITCSPKLLYVPGRRYSSHNKLLHPTLRAEGLKLGILGRPVTTSSQQPGKTVTGSLGSYLEILAFQKSTYEEFAQQSLCSACDTLSKSYRDIAPAPCPRKKPLRGSALPGTSGVSKSELFILVNRLQSYTEISRKYARILKKRPSDNNASAKIPEPSFTAPDP